MSTPVWAGEVVRVVGTGLVGTSVALGLRGLGAYVMLSDPSPTALALAADVGAGVPYGGAGPEWPDAVTFVVVAAPPDVTGDVVTAMLAEHPNATVTDVASVKALVLADVAFRGGDLTRYVGGHPMAGKEKSGPSAAQSDLFLGRPWVVCPTASSSPARVAVVEALALALGATPVTLGPQDHDDAVALISHVPQVAASLVAARLVKAPEAAVGLAGQGLRDVTRIAGSDPTLWAQILAANAAPVGAVLRELRSDLDGVISALAAVEAEDGVSPAPGARGRVARLVGDGNEGRDRIPGKHGTRPTRYATVTALVPDRPGEIARLLTVVGAAGINLEELRMEHSTGQAVGMVEISVLAAAREDLTTLLRDRGWHVVVD